jgi:hypothetical protein
MSTVVKADPGFFWITRPLDDPEELLEEAYSLRDLVYGCKPMGEPIVSWAHVRDEKTGRMLTRAITLRGEMFARPGWASGVIMPDGRVYVVGDGPVNDLMEFFVRALREAGRLESLRNPAAPARVLKFPRPAKAA